MQETGSKTIITTCLIAGWLAGWFVCLFASEDSCACTSRALYVRAFEHTDMSPEELFSDI